MPFGMTELLLILIVLTLLFGASRLPKLARSVSEARRELRGSKENSDTIKNTGNIGNTENETA